MAVINRLSHLKSLSIGTGELDDQVLLQISKLQTLSKLEIKHVTGTVTEQGWLQLARLGRLEYLNLPIIMLSGKLDLEKENRLKQELKQRMPETIVK